MLTKWLWCNVWCVICYVIMLAFFFDLFFFGGTLWFSSHHCILPRRFFGSRGKGGPSDKARTTLCHFCACHIAVHFWCVVSVACFKHSWRVGRFDRMPEGKSAQVLPGVETPHDMETKGRSRDDEVIRQAIDIFLWDRHAPLPCLMME